MADLVLKDVAKAYGEVKVLKDINLDIKTGELIVFVGPSARRPVGPSARRPVGPSAPRAAGNPRFCG